MNIGNDPKKRLNMSIKPMLNIRPGSPDGRYTLVIQLILERRRGVLFTPYRLLPEEFDLRKRKAVAVNQRKTHVAHIRDVNGRRSRASSPNSNGTENPSPSTILLRLTAGDTTTATCTLFSSIRSRS